MLTQGGFNLTSLGTGSRRRCRAANASRHVDRGRSRVAGGDQLLRHHRRHPGQNDGGRALNSALTTNYALGISSLVDADMNVASTRLQALQTQQQLGIQSLSIANQNSQLILKLFNGYMQYASSASR